MFVCATYDLLCPILTTKLWRRLGDPFLRGIYHLVVTIGHNKSYADSSHKKSLAGSLGIFVIFNYHKYEPCQDFE